VLKIDADLLVHVGLAPLPADIANIALRTIYDLLEARVGVALANLMTNEQLDDFERFFDGKDDAGAFGWLEANFPNYKDIVQARYEELVAEVAAEASGVREALEELRGEFGMVDEVPAG
jgi:hypothetical protein